MIFLSYSDSEELLDAVGRYLVQIHRAARVEIDTNDNSLLIIRGNDV